MSFKVEQKVKGKIYVYQVESYWDPVKGQSRQRRTYLGRKDEKSGKVTNTDKSSLPKGSHSFGGVYLLKKIITELGLHQVLKKSFPDTYERYLYIVMYKILTADPYYLYSYWAQESLIPESGKIDSQRISEMLQTLGENESGIEKFFCDWIKLNKGDKAIMFDITSFSSYSQNNELLEFGYNRGKEDMEQVNLGIISKESNSSMHMPMAYRIYPGSISDVTTLKNVIELVDKYKMELSICVMGKGFYSQENIKNLHEKGLKYLIPIPFSTTLAKQSIPSDLGSSLNSFTFRNNIYFYTSKKACINSTNCIMHIYLDKAKKVREETKLMRKISELELVFQNRNFKNKQLAEDYIEETLKSKKKFFKIRKIRNKFQVFRNKDIIDAETEQLGVFIIITNQKYLDRVQVLDLYRNKDGAEKIFLSFKHDINEKRTRTKSASAMKGSFFISFLSLIVISHINHVMDKKNLFKEFTKQELIKSLSALKVYTLANNQSLLAEVTRKQKNIFSAFKLKKLDPSYNLAGF